MPPSVTEQLIETAPVLSLAYHAARQVSAQWRAFAAALAGTFYDNVEADDADAFLRDVGGAMARALPLPKVETLEALETAMNARWAEIDWGWVRLREGQGDVRIIHGASPSAFAEDTAGNWARAAVPVLQGVYRQWFEAQDGPAHLDVSLIGERAEPLVLRYGR